MAYIFKRFINAAIIIFCIFVYFNYHSGLSIPTFFSKHYRWADKHFLTPVYGIKTGGIKRRTLMI